jgi:MATE family multidrug resistance protein
MQLGVFGASMALNFTYTANFLLQEIYVRLILRHELKPFSARFFKSETLEGWATFLKLGVPGTLMQCFEWWVFEILAIFAGLLGTVQLAAHVAVINVCAFVFMIPLGIQFTASGLVGSSIGANNPSQAKKFALAAVLYSAFTMGIFSIILTT